jgi:hypothetical protein
MINPRFDGKSIDRNEHGADNSYLKILNDIKSPKNNYFGVNQFIKKHSNTGFVFEQPMN